MLPLLSVLTQFLVVALVVTAAALGTAVGYFYVRARRAHDAPRELSAAERRELERRDAEIAAIRARIEEMYHHQRTGSETQLALVGQQIEELQRHLKARARQIEGLQSQLRHEIQQREQAMRTLQEQLAEGLRALQPATPTYTAAALPEASTPAPEPTPEPAPGAPSGWTWEPVELDFDVKPTVEPGPAERPAEDPAPDLLSLFEVAAPRETDDALPTFETLDAILDASPSEEPFGADPFGDLIQWAPLGDRREDPTEEPDEAAAYRFDDLLDNPFGGAPEDEGPFAQMHEADTSFGDRSETCVGDGFAGDGPSGDGLSAGPPRPAGAEDLTVLPMIDAEREATLFGLGVLQVEDIARWSRADARRIAAAFPGVSEDVIMNEWVFAAQSVLFDRYQAELRARRAAAAT